MVKPLWKTAWKFRGTQDIEVSYDPAIPLMGLGPEKITIQNDMCTLIFRAALFIISPRIHLRTMRTSIH